MYELEEYLRDFLNSEHPHRRGPVCPFMRKVISDDQLLLIPIDSSTKNVSKYTCCYISEFIARLNKQVLVLQLPSDFALNDAKKIARKMRIRASLDGYMIGAFGPGEDTPSLYSQDFFPFRPNQVIIVLRIMVPHDEKFFENASPLVKAAMKLGFQKRYSVENHKKTFLERIIRLIF